jgi:dihydrolipoamide dehydrogenase
MTDMEDVVSDCLIVGGGSGGFAAAVRAAQLGGKVTLIEKALYGGNCMNKACIPTKVLMTAARSMASIRKAGRYGIQVEQPQIDMEALHERKDLIIEGLRMGTEQLLADRGIHLVEGQARLIARDTVEVNGQRVRSRHIILATGSVAAQPVFAGVDLPGVIGTEEALELRQIPGRLAILGSEPWNMELAQYFHSMGSQVTLIEEGRQLLPEADRDISQRLGKLLHDRGVVVKRGVAVQAIQEGDKGTLAVLLAQGKGEVFADKVLASRHLPNSTGLGLRELGVKMECGAVLVNEHLQTSIPNVYAVGDIASPITRAASPIARSTSSMAKHAGLMWSHKANAEGIVAAENAMGRSSKMDYNAVPRCLYTWPEVGWVGLTEEQAEAQGIGVSIGKVPVAINPYAMILDETAGVVKVIASRKYGKILGAHIMAPGAVDLINVVSVAMLSEATVGELMRLIPAHPSIGEALVDAAMDVEKRSLHLPDW